MSLLNDTVVSGQRQNEGVVKSHSIPMSSGLDNLKAFGTIGYEAYLKWVQEFDQKQTD